MREGFWVNALRSLDGVADAHSTEPVPLDQSVSAYRISAVMLGIAFSLTSLYTGAELASTLGLAVGVRAAIVGSVVLVGMSVPTAIVGARTRLSTYMIVLQVFGVGGARWVNLVLTLILLTWYAITAELFGRTFYLTAALYLPANAAEWFYTLASSILVIATTVFGFKAINRLSLVAAPLLIALTFYVAWRALGHASWSTLTGISGTNVDLTTGISAVIGGMIVNVVLMPDVTRYSRSTLNCVVISLVGNGIGGGLVLVLAMIPTLAFGEIDPMKYMATLGLVAVAFTILVVSTWTINAINLYSTGLATSAAFRFSRYGRLVIGVGIVGSAIAMIGVADRLIEFMVVQGLIVPPIAAVYLTDVLWLGRDRVFEADIYASAVTNVNALVASSSGALIGLYMYYAHCSVTGVPTIESFVIAGLTYALAEAVRTRQRRDRLWRLAPST